MFTGVITALVTPFRDGAVDEPALRSLVDEQIGAGVHGLVAVGTTGESPTLDHAEHLRVIEVIVEQTRRRIPVLAGTGSNSTREAIELSREAKRLGADGLLQVTPYYNRPTQDGLYRHFAAILAEVDLPTVVYNVPGRTGVDLLPETLARLAELPRVVGVKEATGNLQRASQILARTGDRLAVLAGDDATAFPLFCVGGKGVISTVSNVAPADFAGMWNAFAAGDLARARELHYRTFPLSEGLFVETNPIPVKCALALMGKIRDEIRPPLYPMAGKNRETLAGTLRGLGLL